MRDSRRTIFRALAAALLFGSNGLTAQESGRQPTGGLEEVVVTARFRQENLQNVPLAVSAFTAETLAANGATSVLDVARWAPNVALDALGQGYGPTVAATVRGLGYADFKATVEPTVTFYVDDVVLARPTGAIMDLLDLERVEVLRGPQGTLFGKNAIGGVMRMISRKPGEGDGKSTMELTRGAYNRIDLRGSFETALIPDKLYSRVSFVSKTRDGFMNDVDYRCAMIRNGTPQLAGVGDGIVGWNTTTNTPIMGVVNSAADNSFAIPTRISDRGSNSNCVVARLGDQDAKAARAMLRFTPGEIFEVNFSADVTDENDTSPYEQTNRIAATLPTNGQTFNRTVALPTYGIPYDQRFQAPNIFTTYAGFGNGRASVDGGVETPNVSNVHHVGTSVSLDTNLKAVQIKMILSHRDFHSVFGQDSDGSPIPYSSLTNDIRYNQDTAELRVSGQLFKGRTSWTAGYFTLKSDDVNAQIVSLNPCVLGVNSCQDRVDWVSVDSKGIFLNTETDLTNKLAMTLGVRRTHDIKDIFQQRYDRTGAVCCGFLNIADVIADDASTDPMASLQYSITDNVHVYGTYQEGFRGGGTNARATGTTRVPFGPEHLTNREIGVKSDLFNKRFRVNASVFDMVYKDIQQSAAGFDVNGALTTITTNAGTASIKGYEIETRLSIGTHWTLDDSIAHLKYHLTDLGAAGAAYYLAHGLTVPANTPNPDDSPARTPPYTASINAGYFTGLPSGAEFSIRLGAAWRDASWWGVDGDTTNPDNRIAKNTLTNFRIAWTSPNRAWDAAIFCTNCADTRTTSGIFDTLTTTGRASVTYVRPREAGISVKRTF